MADVKTSTTARSRGELRPRRAALPAFRPFQLANLVDAVPVGEKWLHEVKYDGYRLQLAVGGGEARAFTRSGADWSHRFGEILGEAVRLKVASALIDGEVVVFDDQGRSRFQLLQAALAGDGGTLCYMAFDLLSLNGEDFASLPLEQRKARLQRLLPKNGKSLRYCEHISGSGAQLLQAFCKAGLEGVVSKQAAGRYVGARSGGWVKTKCVMRQEFVIVGWLPSDKARAFRSLILAIRDGGELRYAGKVGTGFDQAELRRLQKLMKPLQRNTATVAAPRSEVRGAHWVRPVLVAEVGYAEMTDAGVLRHASYVGLREDKPASQVELERRKPVKRAASKSSTEVHISNRERVIYPEAGITKGQLADYYQAMAPVLLPWVGDRPISLVRCPQGRAKKCFFQKHDAGSLGDAMRSIEIREKSGGKKPYLYLDSPEGLLACVQMGTIEFHGWGARVADVETPDRLVFDLDPDEGLGFAAVRDAARHLHDILRSMGLVSFPLLTGGKGVHVVAPLTGTAQWPAVKDFAQRLAQALAHSEPERFTAALSKQQRKGRIFIDYLRNQRGATAVLPYSARARAQAPVAAPVSWRELKTLTSAARFHVGEAATLLKRARSKALAGWGRAEQALPKL